VIAVGLGVAWAVLAALPLLRRGARACVRDRAGGLRIAAPATPRAGTPFVSAARTRFARVAGGSVVGRVVNGLRARRTARRADAEIRRDLPVVLDLLGVAIGAGCTPYLAVDAAVRWSPPGIGARLDRVVRATGLGAAFPDALDELARTTPSLEPLVDALLASDRLGAPVGPALARLADEERAASRRRAEAHARRVPVRLLFPLVFLVLPAFGLLTVVPALLSGLART
jgi:tight adherence protein C